MCPRCESDVDAESKCLECGETCKREELKSTGALFHDFRRAAARNLVRAGVPVPVAMKITGHRTDSMFRRDGIVCEEQKRDALAKTQLYLSITSAERKVIRLNSAGERAKPKEFGGHKKGGRPNPDGPFTFGHESSASQFSSFTVECSGATLDLLSH